ncbi:hypothetical protein EC973_006656 [Apophysomyces ossiformis]|uniref:Uncharacterized protein n=1 Tax=Apophysomyces ossiformis TaxID=679940 RepID=A0A8H7BQG6_9FUNG|nr:hypothetical protein EC973_006656 [Apophysomyces ossiformis]
MGEEIDYEWQDIDEWLHQFFVSPNPIPTFNRNQESLRALQQLRKQNETANEIMQTVSMAYESIKPKHQENELGFDKSCLSEEGALTLETLAKLALHLGINSEEIGSYDASIANLRLEYMDAQLEHTDMEEVEHALNNRIEDANQELFKLKEMLKELDKRRSAEKKKVAEWQRNSKDLEKQIQAEKADYVQQQKRYDATGVVQQRLRLVNIKRLDEELQQMEADLEQKKLALEQYDDFPPDMVLASLKLQEGEDKLHQLRQERERLLGDIAENVH